MKIKKTIHWFSELLTAGTSLTKLLWVIAIVIPFLKLSIAWAVFTLVFVAILLPLLDVIIFGLPIKLLMVKGHQKLSGLATGFFEAIITIIIGLYFVVPSNFVLIALFLNSVNQYTRYVKSRDIDELFQFYGVVFFSVIFLITKTIIN